MCNPARQCSTNAEMCSVSLIDASPEALPFCYGGNSQTWPLRVCFAAPPTGSMLLGASPINTDTGCPLEMTVDGVTACVIAGQQISITATLHAHGSLPLVLVATDEVRVVSSVAIDLVGDRNTPPAGGEPASCSGATPPVASFNGAGGGAGGSFSTLAGFGGHPTQSTTQSHPNPVRTALELAGGCAGVKGGMGEGAPGAGGGGGGAIYIAAGMRIAIDGAITVSGQGGGGGAASMTSGAGGGAGGGGSGGLIVLDAPSITLAGTSVLMANGGGGGGGGGVSAGGSSNVAFGGNGFAGITNATVGVDGNSAGGGGGGGGEIFVLSPAPAISGVVTPQAVF
jgi:hypothetical protein